MFDALTPLEAMDDDRFDRAVARLRADLLDVTVNSNESLRQLSTHSVTENNPYASPKPFYELILNCNDVLENFKIMVDQIGNAFSHGNFVAVRSQRFQPCRRVSSEGCERIDTRKREGPPRNGLHRSGEKPDRSLWQSTRRDRHAQLSGH